MSPRLVGGQYFIASVGESELMALADHFDNILAIFREEEGISLAYSDDIQADIPGLSQSKPAGPFALITFGVHSDLMAVGFLAKITAALAAGGISVNAYSAFHHDHILVPYGKKDHAMGILGALSGEGA